MQQRLSGITSYCPFFFNLSEFYRNKILAHVITTLAVIIIIATSGPALASSAGSISGSVLDSDNLPLKDVTVRINSYSGSYTASATTDPSGHYSFTTLPSDLYTVQFAKTGYLSRWNGGATSYYTAMPITLNASDALTDIDAKLPQGGNVRGTVIDATGAPISGANVFARRANGAGTEYLGSTDTSGNYAISGMESGIYHFSFSANSYQMVWYGGTVNQVSSTPVVVAAPDTTTGINCQLGLGGSVNGTITDAALNPLPNVEVSLNGPTNPNFPSMSTSTDASGNYTFKGVHNGTYYVQAAYSAWYGGATINTALPITIASPADAISGISIALDTGLGSISGTVTDINNVPISNASLSLYDSTGKPVGYFPGGNTTSDTNGYFSFGNLKSGNYYIWCFSMGMPETWYGGALTQQTAAAIAVTSPNTVSGVNIKMGVGSRVSGTVTDAAGFPVSGINVDLCDSSGNAIVGGGTTTDSKGSYQFSGFPVGTYYVQFYPPVSYGPPVWYGGATSQKFAAPVVITGPNPITGIDVQIGIGARISGSVRGSLNTPISEAMVTIFDQAGIRLFSAESDSTGAYQFTGIPAGMYFILFAKNGMQSSWYGNAMTQQAAIPIVVNSTSVVSGIDGLLPLGGRISGTVTDTSNAPIPSVLVTLFQNDGTDISSTSTDSSGNYSLAGIGDGKFYISFSSTGQQKIWYGGAPFMQSSTPVVISGSNYVTGIDVQLGAGGSISGVITNGDPYISLCLYDISGRQVAWTRPVDSSGYYRFTGLQSGTYYVQANHLLTYETIWYGGRTFQTATPIEVTAPQTVSNIDLTYDVTGMNWMYSYVANNGTITGSPAGILCSKEITSSCSAVYATTETVTLTATPDADSYFAGWGGDCQGTSVCALDMSSSHFVSASFQPAPKAKIGDTGYLTLNFAYTAAGPVATILTLDSVLAENFVLSDNKDITIHGGYNSQYSTRSGMPTVLSGSLIIRNGRLTVDGLTIGSN